MGKTAIEWVDESINPGIYGCSPADASCARCYAARLAVDQVRRRAYPPEILRGACWSGTVVVRPEELRPRFARLPKEKPTSVFVASMADLFHDGIPDTFLAACWAEFALRPHVRFLVLSKRSERMRDWSKIQDDQAWEAIDILAGRLYREHAGSDSGLVEPVGLLWPLPNVSIGVSCGTTRGALRIWHLVSTPAAGRFVSVEPLIQRTTLGLRLPAPGGQVGGLVDQIIVGGETGRGARPCNLDWISAVLEEVEDVDPSPAVFVKQLGAAWGSTHHLPETWPEVLRRRELAPAMLPPARRAPRARQAGLFG